MRNTLCIGVDRPLLTSKHKSFITKFLNNKKQAAACYCFCQYRAAAAAIVYV